MIRQSVSGLAFGSCVIAHRCKRRPGKANVIPEGSGDGFERQRGVDVLMRGGLAVRAAGPASLGASAQSLVNDGLDGARASAAFGAATEAAINLLGTTRKVLR